MSEKLQWMLIVGGFFLPGMVVGAALCHGQVVSEMIGPREGSGVGRHYLKFYALDRNPPNHESHEAHNCIVVPLGAGELFLAETCYTEDAPVLVAPVSDRIPLAKDSRADAPSYYQLQEKYPGRLGDPPQ